MTFALGGSFNRPFQQLVIQGESLNNKEKKCNDIEKYLHHKRADFGKARSQVTFSTTLILILWESKNLNKEWSSFTRQSLDYCSFSKIDFYLQDKELKTILNMFIWSWKDGENCLKLGTGWNKNATLFLQINTSYIKLDT